MSDIELEVQGDLTILALKCIDNTMPQHAAVLLTLRGAMNDGDQTVASLAAVTAAFARERMKERSGKMIDADRKTGAPDSPAG